MLLIYFFGFQYPFYTGLSNWIILSSWAAILLIIAALAFLQMLPTRKVWWHYLALLLVSAVAIWTLKVAYNGYQYWLYLTSLPLMHGNILGLPFYRLPYLAAIHACQFQFALSDSVLVLLIISAAWRLKLAFTRKLDIAPGRYYGRLVRSLSLAAIGLCGLAIGVFLITKLYPPLFYGPQVFSYLSHQPTTLELIGLFIVCLGGPLILLLLGLAAFVERRLLVRRFASRESRLPAMEMRSSQRT